MSDLLASVKSLAQEFQHFSAKECREALEELLDKVASIGVDLPPESCKAVLQFVLSIAAPRCADKRSLQWHCLQLVSCVGRVARCGDDGAARGELHSFFFKLAKKEVKSQRMWKAKVMTPMLQNVLRFAQSSDMANAPTDGENACGFDVVSGFMQALSGEMGRAEKWEKKWWVKTSRALARVLSISPKVLEHAVETLKKEGAPSLLIAAVGSCAKEAGADGAHRASLVEFYVKNVLETKTVQTECALDAWSGILSLVKPEEFEKQLLPTALRMMKRNPAAVAVSFPALVSHMKLDLSPFAKEVLDPFAWESMKTQDKRSQGITVIRQVVQKAVTPASAISVAELWVEAFKKTGKADEKQAYLMAIAAMLNSFPKTGTLLGVAGLGKLADPSGDIAKVASTEANEDTRALLCKALGAALTQIPVNESEPLGNEILKQLTDKKASDKARIAVLECLAEVSTQSEGVAPPWLGVAVERSLPLAVLAATKPVQRLQSLRAWSVCASLAALQPEKVGTALKKEHLALIKDGPSFLNSVQTIVKAPAAELASQAGLWRSVLAGHISSLPVPSAGLKPFFAQKDGLLTLPPCPFAEAQPICRTGLVLLAALHNSAASEQKERQPDALERLGLMAAAKLLPDDEADALILLMTETMAAWLAELAQLPREGPQKPPVSVVALRRALLDLCEVAVAIQSKIKQTESLAMLALLLHHPLLSTRSWPTAKLWTWMRTDGPFRRIMKKLPVSFWQHVRKLIDNAFSLPCSDRTGFRQASSNLAGILDTGIASTSAEKDVMLAEINGLVELCTVSLHSEEIAKEKDEDVKIYFAPEGILWTEEGTYKAELAAETNVKKNKFLKGLYDGEEDLVAEKKVAAPPKASSKSSAKGKAKPSAKSSAPKSVGQMTTADIEAEKMQEQSQTRARIRTYLDKATFALVILSRLAQSPANKSLLDSALPGLLPHFVALLKSPLTALQSRRSLRSLVNAVISLNDVQRRDLLPEALQVAAKNWMARSPMNAGTPGDTPACEAVLESVTSRAALPAAALSCVLPIVLRTLHNSTIQIEDLCAIALNVLEKQLQVGAKIPGDKVDGVFEAFSVALLALPGKREETQAALLSVGKCLVSVEEELAKLSDMYYSDDDNVRSAVIAALAEVQNNEHFMEGRLDGSACRAALRLGALDEKTSESAQETLEGLGIEADQDLMTELVELTQRPGLGVELQNLIARALAQVLEEVEDADTTTLALDMLMQKFQQDTSKGASVARSLEHIFKTNLQDEAQVLKAFRFLLRKALGITTSGTPEAIELRDILLASGIGLIEKHGEEHVDVLFSAVEDFEDSGAATAAGESARLGVAVFLGALSKHLSADNPKIVEILPRLVERLQDPESTESVQNAIVKVMPGVVKQQKEQASGILEKLLDSALGLKTNPVTRRGAAMGLGGVVKGLGIGAVAKYEIIKRVETGAGDKKNQEVRRGALCCLEGLTTNLGRLFDPYVVSSLPLLLQAFSDPSQPVQAASKSASSAMMAQLSGPGMKQVLKPLLEGIVDKQWKTKLGSIELLAAMTNCLPKELAKCLPQVVPALCQVINDQHNQVKAAARDALDRVGNIISSPELRALAPELIEALVDGAQFEHITKRVLDQLLGTSFVHHIDAPSLSLVCPLVQRALKERSAEMKRKGAQIVGSMVLLIKDPKDIAPYLPSLVPNLKVTLVDPIPDVRQTSAKAFGVLAKNLPEDMIADVLPWLFSMLCSEESSVERSGAAHGLSEVLIAQGGDRIEELLPDIREKVQDKDAEPAVKEGYLGLFVYLPAAMGEAFAPYLSDVLEDILQSLADDMQSVRETALKACQTLIKQFGASHTALILPPLEEGVFDLDWRIRHGSVQLVGQLIEQILRAHRIPVQNAELMFCEALPKEWRCHMLASLYIVRSDEHAVVKQACASVWKACVQNTPRTLKELLPALMKRLITGLASENREKQRVAARCVGDLVGKLGERVMLELMPIFTDTLSNGDAHVREGVCVGLAELINATNKAMLADYLSDLIPAIRQAIIDEDESVRNSASVVVALLHDAVGSKATTDIVTWVLTQLAEEDVEEHGYLFLSGLEQLISKQKEAVLPMLLRSLANEPEEGWSKLQVRGFAVIACVPDAHTVHRHLSDVMPVFIGAAGDEDDKEMVEAALESSARVIARVEASGIDHLISELNAAVQCKSDAARRGAALKIYVNFFETTEISLVALLPMVLPVILPAALDDNSETVLAAGVSALNAIVKKIKKEELTPYVTTIRDIVFGLVSENGKENVGKLLPGLCSHKALEPLYPIYQEPILHGSAEQKELAAKGLGDLVNHTSEAALKPYVVKITGPLIRIVGDRVPGSVKKAIVETLKALLVKGGIALKPFLPQLQTSYIKCLQDPTRAVQEQAADSLGVLVRLAAKTDPLIKELSEGLASQPDPTVKLAMNSALGQVLLNAPAAVSEESQNRLFDKLTQRALGDEADDMKDRELSANALGLALRRHCSPEKAVEVLEGDVAAAIDQGGDCATGAALTMLAACKTYSGVEALDGSVGALLKKLVAKLPSTVATTVTSELKKAL